MLKFCLHAASEIFAYIDAWEPMLAQRKQRGLNYGATEYFSELSAAQNEAWSIRCSSLRLCHAQLIAKICLGAYVCSMTTVCGP